MCHFLFLFFFIINAVLVFFFFFFQAEDGIRDLYVTGVQTCALPIFCRLWPTAAICSPDWVTVTACSCTPNGRLRSRLVASSCCRTIAATVFWAVVLDASTDSGVSVSWPFWTPTRTMAVTGMESGPALTDPVRCSRSPAALAWKPSGRGRLLYGTMPWTLAVPTVAPDMSADEVTKAAVLISCSWAEMSVMRT